MRKIQGDSDILVVDDNLVNQKVLCKVLESNGYKVLSADDGAQALEQVAAKQPDLILLDVQMPGIDGFEVCRRLKSNPETSEIPVVFITASDTVEAKVEGFKVGAVDYIPRPIQMPEVLARVSNHLTIQKLQREIEKDKEHLEKILSALPLPYFIFRVEDGTILEMNPKACSALDVAPDELLRFKVTDFYAEDLESNHMQDVVAGHAAVANMEVAMKTRSGAVFTTLVSATPLQLASGEVYFVTFNDITQRKEMEVALERAATTDYLTETFNRRAFSQRAIAERQRANRNKHPLCLLMLDIDHFKSINDTYGHDIGDEALKVLVDLIGQNLRSSDALGRLGGEEFALLLPETEFDGALILAERIRKRVEAHKIVLRETDDVLTMTVSGGLVIWEEGVSYEDVLKLADDCLYAAKNAGRNQIQSP